MSDQPNHLPRRKSPRAVWLDYNDGDYFITVCTKDKKHYFGKIVDGTMHLTAVGSFLEDELQDVNHRRPNVIVRCFVVMPNHFHAIVRISSVELSGENSDAPRRVPTREERLENRVGMRHETSNTILSTYMCHLKGAVTRFARQRAIEFCWQPRYHDHHIRGIHDGNNIAQYIEHNVQNWAIDCFNV